MSNAPLPQVASSGPSSPADRAAEELRGWLDAGERLAVLLAPRGAARRDALDRLAHSVEGRFAAEFFSPEAGRTSAPSTLEELRGRRALLLVEHGEELGAEGARALRASLEDPAGVRCAVVALAADEAGAVLAGLGSRLEVVVLRDPYRASGPRPLRAAGAVAAALLATASIALAALFLVPGFRADPVAPLPAAAPALPAAAVAPAVAEPALPAVAEPALPAVAAAPPAAEPAPLEAPRAAEAEARARVRAAASDAPNRALRPDSARRRTAERAADTKGRQPAQEPAATRSRVEPRPAEPPRAPAAPAGGWLVVNAIPRAEIHLDGAAIGQTPIVRHPVTGGPHRVIARFGDGRADERTIQVAGGELYLIFDGR